MPSDLERTFQNTSSPKDCHPIRGDYYCPHLTGEEIEAQGHCTACFMPTVGKQWSQNLNTVSCFQYPCSSAQRYPRFHGKSRKSILLQTAINSADICECLLRVQPHDEP